METCNNCKKREAQCSHTCPYQVDINGDEDYECECCEECEHECAMDI